MSDDNVITFSGITKLDMPPDRILEDAKGRLDSVVVIGYDTDGDEFFASSIADGADTLWLLERLKMKLLRIPDVLHEEDEE